MSKKPGGVRTLAFQLIGVDPLILCFEDMLLNSKDPS